MPTKEIVTQQPLVAMGLTIATVSTWTRPSLKVGRVLSMSETDAITCREEEDAYARLFAAAPELLALLKHMVGLARMTGPKTFSQYAALLADADAAIAKAEGVL